jgi:hypothetical protein
LTSAASGKGVARELTKSARLVYADGSMNSGIREAKRLLSQPRVRL